MLIKRRDNTQQRFKVFIITLLVMLPPHIAKAGTYTGNDNIQVVLQTAEALSVVLDDNNPVFNDIIPGDVIDAELGFTVTGSEDRSITCVFRKPNGQTISTIGQSLGVRLFRQGGSGWLESEIIVTLNSCDVGEDNTLGLSMTIPASAVTDTTYQTNTSTLTVSYQSSDISMYT